MSKKTKIVFKKDDKVKIEIEEGIYLIGKIITFINSKNKYSVEYDLLRSDKTKFGDRDNVSADKIELINERAYQKFRLDHLNKYEDLRDAAKKKSDLKKISTTKIDGKKS
jgi:hypothetical protein